MIWPMQLGVPLRRLLASNWFATIIRIGNTGFGEIVLRYDRKEQPPGQRPSTTSYTATFKAQKTGEAVRLRQRRRYRHPPVFRSFLCVEQQGKGRSDARACERPITRSGDRPAAKPAATAGGAFRSALAEHALEDRVDVLEVIAEVELLSISASLRCFFTSASFFSRVWKSPSPRHTGIALRCTNL